MAQSSDTRSPWWLDAGSAQCIFCNGAYHEEAAYVCARCDRPVCIACAVIRREPRETLCPECDRPDTP